MKKVYEIELSECFSVTYMTTDMSIVNLYNPFFIKFNEDGVTSFSSGKPKEPDGTVDDTLDEEKEEQEEEQFEHRYMSKMYRNILNTEILKEHSA